MSDSVVHPAAGARPAASFEQPGTSSATFAAVFVMSLSSLLLELALTRLFSVILFYHFAFLAISIALLGLGAGGVFSYVARSWLARWDTRRLGATICAVNAIIVVAALEIVLHVPVELRLSSASFLRLTAIYMASAVPFLLTGLVFSVVFAREKRQVASLYGADLVGGAVACLLLVPLMNVAGGPNTVLLAAVGMAVASVLWAGFKPTSAKSGQIWGTGDGPTSAKSGQIWGTKERPASVNAGQMRDTGTHIGQSQADVGHPPPSRKPGLILTVLLLLLIAANFRNQLIDVVYIKGAPEHRDIEFVRWNAISRVDVYNAGAKLASIDADASTAIMNVDPHNWPEAEERHMMAAPPAMANVLRPRGRYAIIGPGGGVDVLRAVANGSPSVTGIEINPLIATDIMRDRYAEYSHHLYQIPEVSIHVSDGRSWVRGSRERFDVLQMTLVDTWASTAAGAFALSENNLYTVEAFKEYFDHLQPDGMIAITRWEFARPREALRVVSVAMEALRRTGVRDLAKHFVVVANGPLLEDGIPVLVLAKKSAFTAQEEAAVRAHLAKVAEQHRNRLVEKPLTALYMPSAPGESAFSALIASGDPYGFSRRYEFKVAPVTDNAPFFFFTMKLGQIANQGLIRGIDWKVNVGVAVLGMVLMISALAVAAFLVLPLLLGQARTGQSKPLFYFICVGLGYILVEIALIQRFVLFLGHPTYAITVVVFLMLLSSGVGSLVSRQWLPNPLRVRVPLAVICAALLVYLLVLPRVLTGLVGLPVAAKLLVSLLLLAPLGFMMGMPFPAGLRALHGAKSETVEWAWALNAASSVLGSVLAMVIAIQFGLHMTLVCGALAYALAALITSTFQHHTT